ncbi:hypothetical protein OY671_003102 [Metschnikowia pulcherrima]|nr:hypothetical protein OY671_003102 [Metschnikowia pulcherrima]
MRSTTFALSALASLAAVTAESVTFSAVSSDKSIDAPISSIHEGAGINYFLVAEGGSGEEFDLENGVATSKQGQYTANVGLLGSIFAAGPAVSPSTLEFDGNTVENYNFFACKNIGDPYSYSTRSYVITANEKGNNTAPFGECTPVSIVKAAGAGASSAVTSAVASSTAGSSHSGWSNGTVVTTDVTVTDYTTYCPASTVVTITTCSDHKCAPTTITASEATTITITGECVVPTTVASSSSAAPAHTSSTWKASTVYTTDVTVTGYTTYCPASTVVTVTTCSNNKCAPKTTTVSEATTLTVTGECVVPTTVTSAVTSTKPSSASTLVTKSAASSSAPASVSTFDNGAGKAAAGAVGLVGALALLI